MERPPAPTDAAARLRGLAEIGELLLRELEQTMEAFATRLREDCPIPGIARLKFSLLADHVPSYLADLAGMLIALDESAGEPSILLTDAADIHRLVAGRHGAQRARLGWNEEGIRCEYEILREEVVRAIRRSAGVVRTEAIEEALVVVCRFLEDAEQTSIRALVRAAAGGGAADWLRGGAWYPKIN